MTAGGLGTRVFSEAEMAARLLRVCELLPDDLDATLVTECLTSFPRDLPAF